jgi:hypothetical protein
MKIRYATGLFAVVFLSLTTSQVGAQNLRSIFFTGILHDYSPSTVSGGPYEIRGEWSLAIDKTGMAAFTADIAMETSDYGITDTTQVDPANPATRGPHTHHISVTNAAVSYDMSVCPANNPPTTAAGVVITGSSATTGNGGPATFEAKGASTIQVCITGGSEVQFSNFSLVYTGPATTHFGPQPIHGAVTSVSTK